MKLKISTNETWLFEDSNLSRLMVYGLKDKITHEFWCNHLFIRKR
jgi:hypothetical protein